MKPDTVTVAQTVIDAMQDMVRIVDCTGKVLAENAEMKKQMGELTGHPCFGIWGSGAECEHCLAQQVYRKKRRRRHSAS